jgi:hypothetical protein
MKRSTQVTAPLLAAAALTILSGCRKPEMQRCVDENNKVVDETLCKNAPNLQGNGTRSGGGGYGGGMGFYPYRYYYGGGGGWGLGSPVYGGSTTPLAGHSYSSSTTRGGFGSTHGGSSEGGGHGGGGE